MKDSAYKQAGVDIDEAANLIERIKPHVKATNRAGVMSSLGGFGALFDLKKTGINDPILVSATDGVGTKIKIAIDNNKHGTIGIDAVAMCVNDLIVQGAEPMFFLDYFATGKLENDVAEAVIAGVAKGCADSGCALIGGETAEMPGLYADGDYDLAGFTVGAVERDQLITGETIEEGDVILGMASNGLHSNGFSLVRHLIENTKGVSYDAPAPYSDQEILSDALLTPTRLYVKPLLEALKFKNDDGKPAIKGMAHITGGGFLENVPRVLPDGLAAKIDVSAWDLPPVFRWLADLGGLSHTDLASTLNCGIGMIVICSENHAEKITDILRNEGETIYKMGEVLQQNAQGERVQLNNLDKAWG